MAMQLKMTGVKYGTVSNYKYEHCIILIKKDTEML